MSQLILAECESSTNWGDCKSIKSNQIKCYKIKNSWLGFHKISNILPLFYKEPYPC